MKKIILAIMTLALISIPLSARQVKEGSEPTRMLDIF